MDRFTAPSCRTGRAADRPTGDQPRKEPEITQYMVNQSQDEALRYIVWHRHIQSRPFTH